MMPEMSVRHPNCKSMTYVHDDVDRLDILPLLAHGANCVVFDCVGLCDSNPIAPDLNAIANYTGLGVKTVQSALTILLFNELIEEQDGGYRPRQYFHFNGKERQERDITLPCRDSECAEATIPTDARDGKKVSFRHDDDDILSSSCTEKSSSFIHGTETKEILTSIGVQGSNLNLLAQSVEPDLAERWQAWVESKPERFTMPIAYMVKQLKANPCAEPPAIHRPAERKREPHMQGEFFEKWKARQGR